MKRTPGKTAAEREQYWTKIIGEARKYPNGVFAYCRDNDIEQNNYYSWFRRLRSLHPEWIDLSKQQPSKKRVKSKPSPKRPETQVVEKAKRRRFSAADKARILRDVEEAPAGVVAAILRREGLYSSQLQKWRAERDVRGLEPRKRGPKVDRLSTENKKLQAENARLVEKLRRANVIIDLQKKVAEILGTTLEKSDEQPFSNDTMEFNHFDSVFGARSLLDFTPCSTGL